MLTQGADAIQEFVEFLRLILQGTSQFRPLEFLLECFGGIVEGAVFGGGLIVEGLVNFVLSLREIPGVLPQALRFVGELAGGAFAEILLHGLELTLSAGGGLGGFGQLLLFELLSRIEDLFPRFVELVASLGHLGGVGGFVHFLAEIVEVLEELFLFLLELFELAREFLLFLLALGVAQLVLELLHFLGQRLLASRELFQPGEHLKALLLFRRRLRGGLAFFFVALVVLFELEGGELFLLLLGTSPARWRLVLAGDLVFAALGTLQPFESALLESEGLIQGASFGFITCLLKGIQRITHALPSLGQCLAQLGILRFFHGFLDHVQGNLLRFGDDSDVIRCILDFFAAGNVADDAPVGVGDLFLQTDKFVGCLLGFARLRRRRFSFAENVLKVAHLSKKHVAHGPPCFSSRSFVFGPKVVGEKLPGFGGVFFELQDRADGFGFLGLGGGMLEENLLSVPGQGVHETTLLNAEIIRDFGFEGQFLNGRDLDVAFGEDDLNLRELVGADLEIDPWGIAIGAVGIVHKMDAVFDGLFWGDGGSQVSGVTGDGRKRDDAFILPKELGIGEGLVDLNIDLNRGAFEHRGLHGLLHRLGGVAGVGGRGDGEIGLNQSRVFKGRQMKVF